MNSIRRRGALPRFEGRGEFPHRRVTEDVQHRQIPAQFATQQSVNADQQERVSAEIEKVLVDPDVSHTERPFPDLRDTLLQQRDRRMISGTARRLRASGTSDQRQRNRVTARLQRHRRRYRYPAQQRAEFIEHALRTGGVEETALIHEIETQ